MLALQRIGGRQDPIPGIERNGFQSCRGFETSRTDGAHSDFALQAASTRNVRWAPSSVSPPATRRSRSANVETGRDARHSLPMRAAGSLSPNCSRAVTRSRPRVAPVRCWSILAPARRWISSLPAGAGAHAGFRNGDRHRARSTRSTFRRSSRPPSSPRSRSISCRWRRDVSSVALLAPGDGARRHWFAATWFRSAAHRWRRTPITSMALTSPTSATSLRSPMCRSMRSREQQVKTGGYGAEYGRSLGGVMNVVTKRGTNEWQGGASVYWSPGSLQEDGKDVLSRDPALIGTDSPYFVVSLGQCGRLRSPITSTAAVRSSRIACSCSA